jgi:hypothetical protein
MGIGEIDAVIKFAVGYGLGGVVAGGVAYLLLKSYLPAYLGEKAKNLATKEDVAEITTKIENVKLQFASALEDRKATHQLRLAALDRRLEAHQEAFALWRELVGNVYTDEIGKTVLKCQDWWDKNCLYLEPGVRQAFIQSYAAAHSHRTLVESRPDAKLVTEHWERVIQVGDLILAAVQLPTLTSDEKEVLDSAKPHP